MPEINAQKPEYRFPQIDALVEGLNQERLEDLQDILRQHQDLVGVVITERGMQDLFEDILHVDQIDPFVINDFFVPGIGNDMRMLKAEIEDYYADRQEYDFNLDELSELPAGGALKPYLYKLFSLLEELTDFVEGVRHNKEVRMRIDDVVSEFEPDDPQLHEDEEIGFIANFDVGDPKTFYAFESFTKENYGPADQPDEVDDEQRIERIEATSNQLVFVGTRLRVREDDGKGLVSRSVRHGLWHGAITDEALAARDKDAHYPRLRMITYQNIIPTGGQS